MKIKSNWDCKEVIKGRIAEVVFEEMMKEGIYTVMPFGYEHTVPHLAWHRLTISGGDIQNIAASPDFAILSKDKRSLYLVEVKFMTTASHDKCKNFAKKLLERWNNPYLFIATPNGFLCGSCIEIVKHGMPAKLSHKWAPADVQKKYLHILREFIR